MNRPNVTGNDTVLNQHGVTAMTEERCPVPPLLVLLVGIVAISFSAIFIKWSTAPAAVIGMYRLVFTILLILPFAGRHLREIRSLHRKDWLLLLVSGLFLGLHFLLWMGSLRYTSVASSTILLTLQPIFVMIGAYFIFAERTNMAGIVSMIVAIIGTALIGWGDIGLSGKALFGDFLSVTGTLAVSVYMLVGQTLRPRMSSVAYSLIVFLSAATVLMVYNLAAGLSMTHYPAREWGIFILLAAVPTVFGHFLFNWLLKYVNATTISMSILGEPVGATFLAFLLLGEAITGFQVFGGVLAILGVGIFMRKNYVSYSETTVQ